MHAKTQPLLEPAPSLGRAVRVPEPCERVGEAQTHLDSLVVGSLVEEPRERGSQVADLSPQRRQPRPGLRTHQLGLHPRGQPQVVPRVPLPERLRLPALLQLLPRVLPDGLQHPVAQCCAFPACLGDHQRLVHQPGQ